jgi:hypothetical protein
LLLQQDDHDPEHLPSGFPMHGFEFAPVRGGLVAVRPATENARSPWTDILDLQRMAGNQAVVQALAAGPGATAPALRLPSLHVQRDDPPAGPANAAAEDIYDDLDDVTATGGDSGAGVATGAEGVAPAVPAGAPGLLPDAEEASYRARGDSALSGLGGPVAGTTTTGHTPSGPIAGFPDWFANLQNRLIASTKWRRDVEEPGQQLLEEYALKRFAVPYNGDASKVPPSIRAYCHYIGRSTSNQRAAAAEGLPHTGEIGGPEGAKMWCAAAGTDSLKMALASLGLKLKGGAGSWTRNPPVPLVGPPTAPTDALIEPGDQVSYIGGGAPAIGGHTTSVVSPSQGEGSVFLHASGNAGGGTSGSVRLTSSKPRAKWPKSVSLGDVMGKSPASIGAPSDKVWLYSIVKYSQMWRDLGTIDTKAPDAWTSGPGAEFVKKYNLEVAPVTT